MADRWVLSYEQIGRKCDEMFREIKERDKMKRGNVPGVGKITQGIKRKLKGLNEEIGQLSEDLERDASAGRITMKEFHKRQDCLEAVFSRQERLQSMVGRDDDRDQLFGGFGGGGGGGSIWESSETRDKDNNDLVTLQKQKLREQDDQVGLISTSLQTTHQVAVAIGDELELHGEVLDEMKDGVKSTTGRVQEENVKITKLEEKANLTWWYVGVGVQSIVLVCLISLNVLHS